ncbi:hypothetical protein LDENG_00053150 [Lucifuga dentata]|nr:hypothetical protein LDENG_00053150 [Lucifuga dentata]
MGGGQCGFFPVIPCSSSSPLPPVCPSPVCGLFIFITSAQVWRLTGTCRGIFQPSGFQGLAALRSRADPHSAAASRCVPARMPAVTSPAPPAAIWLWRRMENNNGAPCTDAKQAWPGRRRERRRDEAEQQQLSSAVGGSAGRCAVFTGDPLSDAIRHISEPTQNSAHSCGNIPGTFVLGSENPSKH